MKLYVDMDVWQLKILINKQGKVFVNELSNSLHNMNGTEQYITSSYHPQSNDLSES